MPSPTFATGHDLVGRYRIIELLGIGHTAEVYLADDLSLTRTVVVKVLLPHLAAHEDVRRAFRDRIVRSATLSHPHVARVFDGGQESGSIFMVCEYLGGGSIEDVLASGRRLAIDDVARLGRDVASALAYLHANGFVHGALSPSKLLLDDEGRVRVSDVALAGLATAYRERLSLADVRYLSPEQVLGEPVGPATDVYSLALILFEAATGTVAFDGMTAEAVLRSRVNQPLPVRAELGTLDMVLAQAAVPDPRLRLDAEQLTNRLNAVVDVTPLQVAPATEVPLLGQFAPLEPRTSIGFRPPSPDQVVGAPARPPVRIQPTARHAASGQAEFEGGRTRRPLEDLPVNRPSRTRRTGFFVAAILVFLIGVGGVAAWKLGLFTTRHTVPSLVGITPAEATNVLKGDGFTLTISSTVRSSTVAVGDIVSQSPAAGLSAKAGLGITVTVSGGPQMVTLPTNLVGENCATATAALAVKHLAAQCPTADSVTSTREASGLVAEVIYQKTKNPIAVPAGSTVVLALSKGPGPAVTTTTVASTVTTTTVASNATTTTVAGEGPRAVPNVVGMNPAEVYAAFKKAVLFYSTVGPNAGTDKWTAVVSEDPAAGTMVPYRSTVVLHVK